MPNEIVIVGGLLQEVDYRVVVDGLRERTKDLGLKWSWIHCDSASAYVPPEKVFRRLLESLRQVQKSETKDELAVVKLFNLHPRSQAQLYGVWPDPILVPKEVQDAEALKEWIFSAEANLVPKTEWHASLQEAAIIVILAKLLRNKDWNKDNQGHNWTKEIDLLGQAPVLRPNFQQIAVEARAMLDRLRGTLLLRKGSGQGNTPREWSINSAYLQEVKQAILQQTLTTLRKVPGLEPLVLESPDEIRPYLMTDEVVSERVRQICRELH
jgi:hypothetical protein